MTYDVIIKNGTIFNGTGEKPEKIDVGIIKEKISKIGNLSKEKAKLAIDASGLYVMPGFIDLTTHSDTRWTLFSHPGQESFIRQGVTTILGGHGGVSLAPLVKKESLQALSKWTNIREINADWQSFDEFFKKTAERSLPLNFASLVGHETLRRNILNNDTRVASKEEIKKINNLLEESLIEGAFGLSINFGAPYSKIASEKELVELFKTIKKQKAISVHHLKNEGKDILPAVSQLVNFLRKNAIAGHIAHFKAIGRTAWQEFENALKIIELSREQKTALTCDFFPYTKTGSSLASLLPPWILSGKEEDTLKQLKDKEKQQQLIDYFKGLTLHYDRLIVASTLQDSNSIGKSISQISLDSGLSPEESIINLLLVNNLRVFIFNEAILEKNIEILAKKPYSMISSDGVGYDTHLSNQQVGLPHPRSFGAFPKVFSVLVKEKNILKWEEAIYKMSGLPAKTLGIKNRGVIKEGNYADVVILNPNTIKDKSTYEKPFQHPEGIEFVFINGTLTLAEGKMQEKMPGKILRKE